MTSPIKVFCLLLLIHLSLSDYCADVAFDDLQENVHQEFQVSPGNEMCLRYLLSDQKSKISLMFFGSNSPSSEVVIYKSPSDIRLKDDSYEGYEERFLIDENEFKEIDVSDYDEYAYIIIRDTKDEDTNRGTFILYDSEMPIPLIKGQPLNMKRFMEGKSYEFTYTSSNNLTFVFSTKVKSKKYVTVKYGGETKVDKKLYDTDEILYLINPDSTVKDLDVVVEEIEPGKENEDFSVVLYENGPNEFIEIVQNEEKTINYLNLDKKGEKQSFFFYYSLNDQYESNTINFKLDPLASEKKYINISAGVYHSAKSLNKQEMEFNFHFDKNDLPIEYDRDSNIFKRIYFKDEEKSFKYRYVFFKVEISNLNEYFGSKDFIITIGDELEVIDLRSVDFYKAEIIDFEIEALFPKYYQLLLDPNERYIFTSPVPECSMFLEGDLLIKNETNHTLSVNHNYQDDPDELFGLWDYSNFTIRIFGEELIRKKIYIEKFKTDEVLINEVTRNDYPLDIELTQEDCRLGKRKYVVGIFNKTLYPKEDEIVITKFWTILKEGEMTLYYRDNILLEGDSLFPIDKEYEVEKDKTFALDNYIDFFTITCTKPGIFSLRSLHKEYSETTITINQNSIDVTSIEGNETTVILLSAPIKPPTEYLYFSLLSVEGEPITIEPDTPGMFNTTTIKGDQLFTLKIKLADFKVDELAVRVNSTERAVIEFLEVIRYNFTEYTVIESDGKTTLKSNHFIRFYDKNIDQIKVKVSFNDLNLVPVSYGFVRLSTDDTNYLPLASQFQEEYNITRKNLLNNEEIIVKNPFKDVKDNKKYLAFIFSIQRYESHEYSIEIGEISEGGGNTILIIILIIVGIIVVVGVIALIIFFIGKRKGGEGGSHEGNFGKFDDMEDDGNNHPLSPEQQ
jgi:hypothetical protein